MFFKTAPRGRRYYDLDCFGQNLKAMITFCYQRMNSQNDQDILEQHLLPFWLHSDHNNHYFQEDNCTMHKLAQPEIGY